MFLLAGALDCLGVFLARNQPPAQFQDEEPANDNTRVVHIRDCRWHLEGEREEYYRKDKPHRGNDIYAHSHGLAHVEWACMHRFAAQKNVCYNRNQVGEVVDGSGAVSDRTSSCWN